MKTYLSYLRLVNLICLTIIMIFSSSAQVAYDYLDVNNVKALVSADGTNFFDVSKGLASYEVPMGEDKHTILASTLWIGGYDTGMDLHVAAQTYKQGPSTDYWSGPLSLKGTQGANPSNWNRVWNVNKSVIIDHINNYNSPGYSMPDEIAGWPGNANSPYSKILAPFVDNNQNGIYEPNLGEYPSITGDQAIYTIFNDNYDIHTESDIPALGIEVHAMAYSFNYPGHLDNTTFVNYKIINRSSNDYNSLYFGIWTDFDIGYAFDDFIGCDTVRNMYIGFNGDDYDEGVYGYGYNPPAQAVVFLNYKMTNFMYYNNDWSPNGNPQKGLDYYYYLQSRFKNGQKLRCGGDGFNNIWGLGTCNHMFHSDPRDKYPGWSEYTSGNTPADRRGLGSSGPYTLKANEIINLDIAYVWAKSSYGGNLGSYDLLKSAVDEVQQLYNNGVINAVNEEKQNELNSLIVYPNPMSNKATVFISDVESRNSTLSLYDISGQLIWERNDIKGDKVQISKGDLSPGIYVIVLHSDSYNSQSKLIIR